MLFSCTIFAFLALCTAATTTQEDQLDQSARHGVLASFHHLLSGGINVASCLASDAVVHATNSDGINLSVKDLMEAEVVSRRIQTSTVTDFKNGSFHLAAQVLLQTASKTAIAKYEAVLIEDIPASFYPLFQTLIITIGDIQEAPTSTTDQRQQVSSYFENRARSFMNAWLYNNERFDLASQKFDELLDNKTGFKLFLANPNPVSSVEGVHAWADGTAKRMAKAGHFTESNFTLLLTPQGLLHVNVDLSWIGQPKGGNPAPVLGAIFHDEWVLSDDGGVEGDNFARIRFMNSTLPTPIHPIA